jgi:MFS family permease
MRLSVPRTGLWSNHDFLKLWSAESVSQVGSQITLVALPLAAALELDASAAQMGILTAAGTLPYLLIGLFAGVWVDRMRRRPILIAMDLGRALLLLTIPLAWVLGQLRIELLYLAAFFVGVQTLFYEVAWVSFLPSVVRRDQLIEGNSKLHASASAAQVAGPGAAGILVGTITAPLALLVDACSFLVSAVTLTRIRTPEPPPVRHAEEHVVREMLEGLRAVFGNAVLRAMALTQASVGFFGYMFLAVYVLYMVEDLGLSSTEVGLVFGLGGLGAVIGAMLAEPLKRRIGIGPTIVLGRILFGVGGLLVPLAVRFPAIELPMVIAAEFIQWLVLTFAVVNDVTLRQAIPPPRMLGRVASTMRFMNTGMVPLGALTGGFLGEQIGLRGTLVVGVIGMLFGGFIVLASPLRSMLVVPESPDDIDGATETVEPVTLAGSAGGV